VHELSLVQGLIAQLAELAHNHEAKRINAVRVSIGKTSGIVMDSFMFCFEALKPESTLISNALLEIKEVDGSDLVLMQVEME
jgi:hydrogenase nickel incorporation protein HypA/HybF